jgi:glycosyltransferase involved in cell wall biosynthesis
VRLDAVYAVYWSLRDPLAQSQSLPVLLGLARDEWRFGLVTFEQPQWRLAPAEAERERERLAGLGIDWRPHDYTKRPPVLSTAWDVWQGVSTLAGLVRTGGARLLHGRGSIPCAMAQGALLRCRAKFFADADGPLSEEYVDAGIWGAGSLPHRVASGVEARALRVADKVAVLTEVRRGEVAGLVGHDVAVLPCGVDTAHFRPDPGARAARRAEIGAPDGARVLVYVGKAGGWYLSEEILDFARELRASSAQDWRLLVLTPDPPERFEVGARERGVPIRVTRATRDEMPGWLSAADAAISFRKATPSQRASSPIKNGEYLSCGLPVVSTPGAGDYSELIERERVGVVVAGLDVPGYRSAARALEGLLAEPGLGERCRSVARTHAGLEEVVLPRYREIYRELLGAPATAKEQ